ncbi:hypothetical protein [Desulforhopalus sp. IMCC35007]|uniref:hypothetical protein n=1 Tax=Desulforhopalus sp. IMCC35007 TaxID=2569543 RepID=UPI0010ADDBA0|nr:hypothetical protein [Desulforhopalus sp. IMCC35007]TKB11292.1 hypothetical protein FCL48_04590 [Desulforhopalus sp. IMCC35007]
MRLISGKLFKTLSHRVDKEIQESLYQNEVFLKSRWSFFERSIVLWSSHYKKYIALTVTLSFLVVANLFLWQPWVRPLVIEYLPHWRKLLDWQGGFLAGQLTIVAVVYPLVIGLISLLFQNKSAKKTIFPIYQKYSGFMFAGLSGLTLSTFIILGYFLRAHLNDSGYIAFCITTAIWLASNILLTAWFFVQTFRMLEEVSRDRLVLRFSIHESCEYDIRERIKQTLVLDAVRQKLLSNPNEQILNVLTLKYSNNDYQELTRIVARTWFIKDIRYRLINIAIFLQTAILNLAKIKGATLVIQPRRNSRNGNDMVVASYDGFKVNYLVKLLIQSAFSFKGQDVQTGLGLSAILNAFVGSAYDALREGNSKDFSDALDNIVNWHTEIALALSFKNDDGYTDNWLLLPASNFLGRSYLNELLGEYHRLARESVERIPDNSRFYYDMLYLHNRIFTRRDKLVKQEIRSLIQGSYNMWYLLIEWRSYSSTSGDMRIANKYEDILYDFVGAWESWLIYIEPRSKKAGGIDKSYLAYITHLEFTASTAISALRFNNYEAAGWGVDMLNNWLSNLSLDNNPNAEYLWRSVLLNYSFLLKDSESPAWHAVLKGNEYDHLAAFNLSFKNASLDLRILTACYILLKPDQDNKEMLVKYVKALLSGVSIHQTGATSRSRHSISSAGDLLGAYIRHRDYRHYGENTYGSWLSSILDSFGRIYEERRVSGRIYSGWGANDPRSMNEAYVEIAISLSERKWRLPNEWEEAILSDAFRHIDREKMISDIRNWIQIAQCEQSYILIDEEAKVGLVSNFCDSLNEIIKRVEKAQVEEITGSDIDQNRLNFFSIASSGIFKNTGTPVFPLSLFEHIEHKVEMDDSLSYELNIADYAKERVALGVETNRPNNEEEGIADCVSANVQVNVLRKLLQYPLSASYRYKSIDYILSDVRRLVNSIACPVLFVGSQALSNTLHRSSYDRDIADKHEISRLDGFGNEYICHVGRCEVYILPFNGVDYCLLTSKELFAKVWFRKITDDQFIETDFLPKEDNENIGNLHFKYWMDIELLEKIPCVKLELDFDEEE